MGDEVADKLAELSVNGAEAAALATPARADDAQASAAAPGGELAAAASSADGFKTPPAHADAAARAAHDSRKLFVGGLPQGSTEEDISAVFEPFGTVEEVHLIKPNPTSESKRGCCFVTFATAASAEEAIKALNGQVCEALGTAMPLLVRVADPPRSREEQRSRTAQQHAAQRMPAQVGVLPGWPGALGYGWPGPQAQGAFAGAQGGQPFFLAPGGSPGAQAAGAQYMGVFPGGYGFGMLPQFAQTQHGEWSEHADSEGNKYYYNSQSGVSQWEPPAHWPAQQAAQLPMMYPYAQAMPAGYFAQAQGNGGAASLGAVLGGAPALGLSLSPMALSSKRGPKGANLAVFCIPNSYTDLDLHEIARPYGNVVYAQVSRHRDTGLSRGYGFVSYESVPEAESAVEGIHGLVVQGRSLRVEKVKADEEPPRAR